MSIISMKNRKPNKMKSTYSGVAIVSAIVLVVVTACNPLNKMNKKHGLVKYTLAPTPLELHNDSVTINVSGRYPEKFFNKKAVATVKPVMKDATTGTVVKEFDSIKLIGESAEGEGQKISWAGGSFNVTKTVPYTSSMENVILEVVVEGAYKTKTKAFEPVEIGKGTVTTPLWVQSDEKAILGADNFTKTSPRSVSAEINYAIQTSFVRPEELRQEDMQAVEAFIQKGVEFEYTYKNVSITSYASPDGETSLNDNLAGDRANSAASAIKALFSKKKVEAGKEDALYTKSPKGEDWAGFKTKVQASEIADKDQIIRIVGMYNNDKEREEAIKNLAAVYTELAEKVLPPLRRSVITISAEEEAKTNEELMELVKSNPSELTIEEILYTATLYNDLNEKLSVYKTAAQVHAGDWRGHNNVGYILVMQNKISEAKAEFDKALNADNTSKVVMNNLGVIARLMGDKDKAMDYYEKAKGAGKEVNYNIGILNIMGAKYDDAVSNMSGYNTFNNGLAQLLNGNTDGALNTVEASDDKATAAGYYLKAIIGARTKNMDMMKNNLKAAVEKDSTLKAKAKKDAEFLDYRTDSGFTSIVE